MKLWQAMKAGISQVRGIRGMYLDYNLKTHACKACAIGTILVGTMGIEAVHEASFKESFYDIMKEQFPELQGVMVKMPKGSRISGDRFPLVRAVEFLFEHDGWSRLHIEAWLEKLDL